MSKCNDDEQKKLYEEIKKAYNVEEEQKIANALEEKKKSQDYTLSNMLIEYNHSEPIRSRYMYILRRIMQ